MVTKSKRCMSLLLLCIPVILVAGVGGLLSWKQLCRLDRVEQDHARERMLHAQDLLHQETHRLGLILADSSAHDDLYRFVDQPYDEYIRTHWSPAQVINLHIGFLAVLDAHDQILFDAAFHPRTGAPEPLPASLLAEFNPGSPLRRPLMEDGGPLGGLLLLPEGPLVIGARPILDSEHRGPVRGTLVMGRWLESDDLRRLGADFPWPLRMVRADDPSTPAELRDRVARADGVWVQNLNRFRLVAYSILNDLRGQPALLVWFDMPRRVNRESLRLIRNLGVGILATTVLGLLVVCGLGRHLAGARLPAAAPEIKPVASPSAGVPRREDVAPPASVVADTRVGAGGRRVLVMEDQVQILTLLNRVLARHGYAATLANDGAEAIRLYKEAYEQGRPFDVVLMDLFVPTGMGGRETICRLHDFDPGIKAVVISGSSDDPVLLNYREYGFKAAMPKPLDFGQLITLLDNVIAGEPVPDPRPLDGVRSRH
jgi:sensor domain CHASE-containing protein/ActR/RegA family two-component response regulator